MKPRIGATLVSTADGTTVVVIRWGPYDLELTCGGALMVDQANRVAAPPAALDAARAAGTHAGRRYHDEVHGVELLCTTAGWGDLAIGDAPLELKASAAGEAYSTPAVDCRTSLTWSTARELAERLDIFHQYRSRADPGVR